MASGEQRHGVMGGIPRNEPKPAEAPAPPPAPPKPALSLSHPDEELRPGLLVHVACDHARPGKATLTVEDRGVKYESFTASASAGFNVLLAIAGSYRLTLKQPTTPDGDDWEAVAQMTFEVPA